MTLPLAYRDDPVWAAEFALGLLDGAERRDAERAYAARGDFAEEVDAWAEWLSHMDHEFAPVAPARRVRRRLKERLWGDATGGARRSGRLGWLVAGLMAAMLVFVAWTEVSPWLSPRGVLPAALAELESVDGALRAVAFVRPDEDVLEFAVVDGAAPSGRVLELWAIQGDDPPRSLGLIEPGVQRVELPDGVTLTGLQLAISEEPPGGSPTGAPTGAVLAAAPVTGL